MRQAPDAGSYFQRGLGSISDNYGRARSFSGRKVVYLGNSFFKAPARGFDSKAGTIVHELSHLVFVNGVRASDGGVGCLRPLYSAKALKELANEDPLIAARQANLIEWYVEREK